MNDMKSGTPGVNPVVETQKLGTVSQICLDSKFEIRESLRGREVGPDQTFWRSATLSIMLTFCRFSPSTRPYPNVRGLLGTKDPPL
jgi:hypothetical protein